ncbi:MAG: glycosyltransferase family A protein [Bacteroidales bacterium]
MNNQLVSIIIPVYNSKLYLEDCLNSILVQTYSNIEILLIDDGSIDGSGEICDGYAKRDSRIQVFHKKNGGVSSARNVGLSKAEGEWVLFIDSDDYVAVNHIADYVSKLHEIPDYNYKSVVFQGYRRVIKGEIISVELENLYFETTHKSQMLKYLHIDHDALGYVWSKIFNLRLIKEYNIKFDEQISLSEDLIFTLTYLEQCNHIFITTSCNYFYRQDNNESLSNRKNDYLIGKKTINTIHILLSRMIVESNYGDLFELKFLDSRFCALLNLFSKVNSKYTKDFIIREIIEYKSIKNIKQLRYTHKYYKCLYKAMVTFPPKIVYCIFYLYFLIKGRISK